MDHFTSIMPLTAWPENFSFEPFLDTLRMMLPVADISHAGRPTELHTRAITLDIGGVEMLVSISNQPLDAELMELAVSLAHNWREGGEAVRGCPAHAIITALDDPQEWAQARNVARLVETAAHALMQHVQAAAHLWGTAARLLPAEYFSFVVNDQNAAALRWVSLEFFQGPKTDDGEDTVVVHTRGLVRFFGYEMELAALPMSAPNAAQIIMSVAQYLLDNGPVLNNGDIIGPEDGARFQVHQLPKERSHGAVKMQLSLLA